MVGRSLAREDGARGEWWVSNERLETRRKATKLTSRSRHKRVTVTSLTRSRCILRGMSQLCRSNRSRCVLAQTGTPQLPLARAFSLRRSDVLLMLLRLKRLWYDVITWITRQTKQDWWETEELTWGVRLLTVVAVQVDREDPCGMCKGWQLIGVWIYTVETGTVCPDLAAMYWQINFLQVEEEEWMRVSSTKRSLILSRTHKKYTEEKQTDFLLWDTQKQTLLATIKLSTTLEQQQKYCGTVGSIFVEQREITRR